MPKKILIVGGGLAGTIIANGLCRQLGKELRNGDISITMLGTSDQHLYQPGLLYLPFGRMRERDLFRDQASVLNKRINFHIDPATNIDTETESVTTDSGRSFEYDYLIIATGSELNLDQVEGMREGAEWYYDLEGARSLREKLEGFDGGKVVINVNAPHKCPMAPLEMTFMLRDYLRERGLLDKTELMYTYPIGRLHSLEPVGHWAAAEFENSQIKSETFFNASKVDHENKIIHSEEEVSIDYDLLITIPPHRGAKVITDSDLGAGGWVPTDRNTLQMDGKSNVFVCGDTTNLPISKAGSTAHFEADTIIDNLVSLVTEGRMATHYDGKVFCFIETGMKESTYVWFNYENPPNPGPPSQMLHWFKLAYNRLYWLSARGLL